ncbi:hypothetical protein QWJ34_00165 [Saccharibacillus sp. CPCC 101409]|uniref:hypothetical protein n=1 Tax=Saccharibacillus sp. CPCC 101409 TaxID=3058041 RepID=UPI0026735572|nr:hypothetical protein [Saccharibacillus sp. CPCC 101409]MDO3408170.1 hypothetical protein [Saccharibacillus sp. CPCC 101409]
MQPRLILVEGLPGSGKSTTAVQIRYLLSQRYPERDVRLFEEGRSDHPADYEGFAYLTMKEWSALRNALPDWNERLERTSEAAENGRVLAYRRLDEQTDGPLPEEIWRAIAGRDVYELPLELHMRLIADRWTSFALQAARETNVVYVFECCFIQNPLTMATIRCGEEPETVIGYVKRLEEIVLGLNPFVVYVDQRDLDFSFRKAVAERPREWSEGFMAYYLQQGYGAAHVCGADRDGSARNDEERDITDTIAVLRARRELEEQILDRLNIPVLKADNSRYDEAERGDWLSGGLERFFGSGAAAE